MSMTLPMLSATPLAEWRNIIRQRPIRNHRRKMDIAFIIFTMPYQADSGVMAVRITAVIWMAPFIEKKCSMQAKSWSLPIPRTMR